MRVSGWDLFWSFARGLVTSVNSLLLLFLRSVRVLTWGIVFDPGRGQICVYRGSICFWALLGGDKLPR